MIFWCVGIGSSFHPKVTTSTGLFWRSPWISPRTESSSDRGQRSTETMAMRECFNSASCIHLKVAKSSGSCVFPTANLLGFNLATGTGDTNINGTVLEPGGNRCWGAGRMSLGVLDDGDWGWLVCLYDGCGGCCLKLSPQKSTKHLSCHMTSLNFQLWHTGSGSPNVQPLLWCKSQV